MQPLISLRSVTKIYPNTPSMPALKDISLEIGSGEAVAIMGPSGSGKSTLLNLIAGLDRPSSGSIRVGKHELAQMNESRRAEFRRAAVGLVFQFFNLLDTLTAFDNVAIAAELAGRKRGEAERRTAELLGRLGLAEVANSFPAQLSGGQRQRVAIARAMVNDPPLLLADEPTGALDRRSGEQVLDLLRDLNRAGGTLIVVTHDRDLASACASRFVHLVDGEVAYNRSPSLVGV